MSNYVEFGQYNATPPSGMKVKTITLEGTEYQVLVLASEDGSIIDANNPLPVSGTITANTGLSQPLTDTQLRNTAVPVSVASVPIATGAATSVNQDTLIALIDTLQELIQRLAPLAGVVNSTAQLRAVVTGAVTATGGGYITSAQEVAALLTQTNSLISSSRLELNNTLPTLANINNCIGA